MASSILQLFISSGSVSDGGKGASEPKTPAVKSADQGLFAHLMKRRVPEGASRSKPQATESSTTESRTGVSSATPDGRSRDAAQNAAGSPSNTDRGQSSGQSDQQQNAPSEVPEGVEDAVAAESADAAETNRDEDIVDIADGYGDELLPDITKDPHNEAIALGLLVGQAVPVNHPPLSTGSSAVAGSVVPETAANVPPSLWTAQQPVLTAQDLLPDVAVDVAGVGAANTASEANAAFAGEIDFSTMLASKGEEVSQLAAGVVEVVRGNEPAATVPAQAPLPAELLAALSELESVHGEVKIDLAANALPHAVADEAAPAQALENVTGANAVRSDDRAVQEITVDAEAELPAPVIAPLQNAVGEAEGLGEVDVGDAVASATTRAATIPVAAELPDEAELAVVESAPKRLGKVAPAALKAMQDGSSEANAAKQATPQDVTKETRQIDPSLLQARGTDAANTPVKPAVEVIQSLNHSSGSTPAVNAEQAAAPVGSAVTPGNFAATLQNAVQIPAMQYVGRSSVAEQVAAQISALPRNQGTQFTLQLTPDKFGTVDVVMDFHKDGHVQLTIRADTKEALAALQRDAHGLERNLQELGLKTDSGSLQFSLRQDQQEQAQQFADAQERNQQDANARANARQSATAEEATPITRVNYQIMRDDGGVDIQV